MLKTNKEDGENYIEKIYNENGYSSVYLEKLNLKEQIILLNSSKEIAMISGTLPHNLLFVRSNPNVTIINKTYRPNIHQFLINSITNANVKFVDAYVAPLPVLYGRGPFLIRITQEFKQYSDDMHFNSTHLKVNTKLAIFDKLKYYLRWGYYYKWYIIKHHPVEEGGFDIPIAAIRDEYIKIQNN